VSRVVAFLRHGETTFHAENRYAGATDVALTATGHEQARRLGRWACGVRLAGLWCSDLMRAIDTAATIGQATGVSPHVDTRFRELDFGQGEGRTRDEMHELFGSAREQFEIDPQAHPLPCAERPSDAIRRARPALTEALTSARADGLLVIITHSTLLRVLTMDLIGIPVARYRTLLPAIEPASGVVLRIDGERTGILAVNPHLDADVPVAGSTAGLTDTPRGTKDGRGNGPDRAR
jgi:broad specificity phosphatase PhoE